MLLKFILGLDLNERRIGDLEYCALPLKLSINLLYLRLLEHLRSLRKLFRLSPFSACSHLSPSLFDNGSLSFSSMWVGVDGCKGGDCGEAEKVIAPQVH